jgi:hypothetical protein
VAYRQHEFALPPKENLVAVLTITYSNLNFLDLHNRPTKYHIQPLKVIKSENNSLESLRADAVAAHFNTIVTICFVLFCMG